MRLRPLFAFLQSRPLRSPAQALRKMHRRLRRAELRISPKSPNRLLLTSKPSLWSRLPKGG